MSRNLAIFFCLIAVAILSAPLRADEVNTPPSFDGGPGAPATGGTSLNIKSQILQKVGIEQRLGAQIPPDANFVDSDGNPVKLSDYFGKRPIILMFVQYNCPMLCTPALNDLCRAMNAMVLDPGTDYDVLTISFNPSETTKLAFMKKRIYCSQIAKSDMAKKAWHFLTGSQDQIQRVTQAAGFHFYWDAANKQYVHVTGLMILTPQGKVSKYFYGLEYSPLDLRLAIADADRSHIGSLATELLLYCCEYDPQTGKYDFAVKNLLRLGGSLTLAILAGFVTLQFARDHGRKKHLLADAGGAAGMDPMRPDDNASAKGGHSDDSQGQPSDDRGPAR